jgi:plastocyanin
MKSSRKKLIKPFAFVLAFALVAGACGGDDDKTESNAGGESSSSGVSADVEKVVKDSLEAENAKDGKAFVALYTDKGLGEYDSGSREEILSGKSENFGQEPLEIIKLSNTKVTGTKATTDINVAPEKYSSAQVVYLATFSLIKKDGDWLIDGFEFKGSPAPASDATVVDVKAQEYAFSLSEPNAPANVAFAFENMGKEQHEMTLFRGPDGTDVSTAKAALEKVDGSELKDLPDGYEADHVSFTEAGEKVDVSFAKPLKAGTYFMVCYIPQGGFGDEGPVNPDGKPHVQLGMISALTVK